MKPFICLFLITPLVAVAAEQKPMTLDDFNRQIDDAARDERYRSSILKQNDLHTLLPDDEIPTNTTLELPVTDPEAVVPKVKQTDKNTGVTAVGAPDTARKKAALVKVKVKKTTPVKTKVSKDYYFPKTLQSPGNIEAVSITFEDSKVLFGISIGSTIPIRLRRVSTNVQPGYIELVTQADVAGRKKILPANSIIFSRPSVVKGSSRLYLNTVRGVTPQGLEFFINGHISDDNNTAGLSGVIKSDGRALARSATAGAVALGDALIGDLSSDAISNAASATSNQLIKEGAAESKANLDKPAFIISTSPQNGTLTVEETF